jgi:phage-related protein
MQKNMKSGCRVLVGKSEDRRLHGILGRKWKVLKWALRETVRKCGVNALVQDKDYWRDLVNTVTNCLFYQRWVFFKFSLVTVRLLRRTVLHGIS